MGQHEVEVLIAGAGPTAHVHSPAGGQGMNTGIQDGYISGESWSAPDAPGTGADGTPLRLFDLLRGPQFTLLQFGSGLPDLALPPAVQRVAISSAGSPNASDAKVFVDNAGHLADAYGGSDEDLVLVRPDGYIGWIGQASDAHDLRDYLERLAVI